VRHAAQARQARMNAAEEKALAAAEAAFAEDDVRSAVRLPTHAIHHTFDIRYQPELTLVFVLHRRICW
jgi:hypothetical protein